MAEKAQDNTWQKDPANIIVLTNCSSNNYVLELPSGRYRLDAGRKMRTLKSVLDLPMVKQLVDDGNLSLETYSNSEK